MRSAKRKDSIAAILKALELGVNWIDTAAVYGLGHSEDIVAKALAAWPGQRPYVFTKCGLRWDSQGKVIRKFTVDSVRQECEDSLRRLRKYAIDLYQVHWPPLGVLRSLRKAGLPWPPSSARKSALDRRFEL